MKMASTKNQIASTLNGMPSAEPNRRMSSGQSSPIS